MLLEHDGAQLRSVRVRRRVAGRVHLRHGGAEPARVGPGVGRRRHLGRGDRHVWPVAHQPRLRELQRRRPRDEAQPTRLAKNVAERRVQPRGEHARRHLHALRHDLVLLDGGLLHLGRRRHGPRQHRARPRHLRLGRRGVVGRDLRREGARRRRVGRHDAVRGRLRHGSVQRRVLPRPRPRLHRRGRGGAPRAGRHARPRARGRCGPAGRRGRRRRDPGGGGEAQLGRGERLSRAERRRLEARQGVVVPSPSSSGPRGLAPPPQGCLRVWCVVPPRLAVGVSSSIAAGRVGESLDGSSAACLYNLSGL
mmetsp:Transcript_14059/g.56074  ORF Transcript_14059/g.56074 Transcript_14059/m.56074 type:complete len:308 (-) Transcript_14059:299-1222(-)